MIGIDNKVYFFDLEKIYKSVNYSDKAESKEKEIMDSYEDGKIIGKTIRELTTPGNPQIDNIRYDLIKTFIIQIITYEGEFINLEEVPFGMKIAINTMIKEGLLVEITMK